MPKTLDFNPTTGQLDLRLLEGSIPEYSADPTTPTPQTAWVLKTGGGGGSGVGEAYGLLLSLTKPGAGGSTTYALKYRTLEGSTVSVALA